MSNATSSPKKSVRSCADRSNQESLHAPRHRDRSGHHRFHRARPRRATRRARARLQGVSPDLSEAGLGRARPGRHLGLGARRARPGAQGHRRGSRSPRSASRTSARPRSCGIARPARPRTTRSCGRTAAPPSAAPSSRRRAKKRGSRSSPGSRSIRTSRGRRSSGCCTPSTGSRRAARARRHRVRHDRFVLVVAADRRRGPRDRRHERVAHARVRHRASSRGATSCAS